MWPMDLSVVPPTLRMRSAVGSVNAVLSIRRRTHDFAMQRLERPAAVEQSRGQFIQQLRMGRLFGPHTKIARRQYQRLAKVMHPQSIGDDPSRERIFGRCNRTGQFEPTAAVAERLWSPAGVIDVADMYRRLELVSRHLEWLGLTHQTNYRIMLERLSAGDPMEPVERYRAAGGDLVEWRLGYLPAPEVDRAYGDSTLAVFPYKPGLDQSGTLLRALGAGVPAVAYDVGGLGENVRRFEAGRVVPAGDVDAMAAVVSELLDDPAKLELARAGARRARETLTWEASARMHLDLYRELVDA